MRVLLVEDERRMADAVAELLRQEKYEVEACYNGTDGCVHLLEGGYDAAVIDVMLPGMNGLDIVRAARENDIAIPILMLTAKSELADKVSGLDNGADDYLTKPFQVEELLARLRALLRRNGKGRSADANLVFGDLALCPQTATLTCTATGQDVRLSEKELHILEYLMLNKSQIVTREALAVRVWGYESNAEYNNVEVYISFVRRKLAFVGTKVEIKALRGLGYELRVQDV